MNLGFWKELKDKKSKKGQPIIVLAPMADVTDFAFRQMIAKWSRMGKKNGGPDVFWTEFVSADGLCSRGREKVINLLKFAKNEKPIVAQIFGSNVENIEKAGALIQKMGFDGIDINMGCPDKTIEKQGAGAALICSPSLAKEIIRAAKRGAPKLPISVKTRLGWNRVEIEEWLPALLEEDIALLTLHARTRKELSLVPAKWEYVKRAVEIRDKMNKETLIFGNGDVTTLLDADKKARESGADGVMIGRGIFGKPWFFDKNISGTDKENKKFTPKVKLEIMLEHSKLFDKYLVKKGFKNFAVMKKHYKAYVNGFEGAKEIRAKLMEAKDVKEVEKMVHDIISSWQKKQPKIV